LYNLGFLSSIIYLWNFDFIYSYNVFEMKYNLLIKGGRVLDPGQDIDEELDVAITGDKISAIEKDISSTDVDKVIDATGKIVTPRARYAYTSLMGKNLADVIFRSRLCCPI
jgi:hypothetical protein